MSPEPEVLKVLAYEPARLRLDCNYWLLLTDAERQLNADHGGSIALFSPFGGGAAKVAIKNG